MPSRPIIPFADTGCPPGYARNAAGVCIAVEESSGDAGFDIRRIPGRGVHEAARAAAALSGGGLQRAAAALADSPSSDDPFFRLGDAAPPSALGRGVREEYPAGRGWVRPSSVPTLSPPPYTPPTKPVPRSEYAGTGISLGSGSISDVSTADPGFSTDEGRYSLSAGGTSTRDASGPTSVGPTSVHVSASDVRDTPEEVSVRDIQLFHDGTFAIALIEFSNSGCWLYAFAPSAADRFSYTPNASDVINSARAYYEASFEVPTSDQPVALWLRNLVQTPGIGVTADSCTIPADAASWFLGEEATFSDPDFGVSVATEDENGGNGLLFGALAVGALFMLNQ